MKKFLIIFCLIAGTLFVYAEKSAFVRYSNGVILLNNFDVRYGEDGQLISIGTKLINSEGVYRGALSLGVWNRILDFNYAYDFLKSNIWSLGVESSLLVGGGNFQNLDDDDERNKPHLGAGLKIGFYTRLKLSESFDLGLQVGVRGMKGFKYLLEFSPSDDIEGYALLGLGYYFN